MKFVALPAIAALVMVFCISMGTVSFAEETEEISVTEGSETVTAEEDDAEEIISEEITSEEVPAADEDQSLSETEQENSDDEKTAEAGEPENGDREAEDNNDTDEADDESEADQEIVIITDEDQDAEAAEDVFDDPVLCEEETDSTLETASDDNGLAEDSETEEEPSEEETAPETSGECGDYLTWSLEDDGTLVIRGKGNMDDFEASGSPWFLSAESIITVRIPDTLTGVGRNAFEGCVNLKDVYYDGTETLKESLVISEGNGNLEKAVWHFGSTAITDGFNKVKGKWGWYDKGKLQTSLTGMIKGTMLGRTAWYYIEKGVFSPKTGITRKALGTDTKWYFVLNGVYTRATGLARKADESNYYWYYVQNGIYTRATGLAQRADGSNSRWYYVLNGRYTKSTGITKKADGSSSRWYYVENGVLSRSTGIAQKADGSSSNRWYYVENGIFTRATGLTRKADRSNNTGYYVLDGIYTKATGLVQQADKSDDGWYYVENGRFTRATGITKKADGSDNKWYYVKSGIFTKETCVATFAEIPSAALYYVSDGVFDRSFNGTYYAFTIQSGKVTARKTSGAGWQYVGGDLYYYRKNLGYAEDMVLTINGKKYIFDYNGKLVKDGIISPLTNSVHVIDKYYDRYGFEITRITLHHMAAVSTGSDCAYYFCTNGLTNSSNYCIGYNGDISCNVVENYGSWTSSNNNNDRRAVCIELSDANEKFTKMTDATIESLIKLCVDLIQRYPSLGGKFDYKADGTGNITLHSMFADKDCPGQWLVSRLPVIQAEVNRRLGVTEGTE